MEVYLKVYIPACYKPVLGGEREILYSSSMKRDRTTDLNNLKMLFSSQLGYDLENPINAGHPFYENYQKLLKTGLSDTEHNSIMLFSLFGIIQYLEAFTDATELKFWINRLTKNTKSVGLYGDVFELYIQWTLIEKKINFLKNERPDFIISFESSKVFIECTSAQFELDKIPDEKQVFRKLKSTIKKKFQEKYINLATALFIDVTNLLYHLPSLNSQILRKALESVEKDLKKNSANTITLPGSVTFLIFEFVENKTRYHFSCNILGNFTRHDVDPYLKAFLEKNFIKGIEKKNLISPKFHH